MYSTSEIKEMLFIDIETTSEYSSHEAFCRERPNAIALWTKRADQHRSYEKHLSELSDSELYDKMAALSPEFSKIIVISIGQIKHDESGINSTSKIRSFYGDNESEVLKAFMGTSQAIFSKNPSIKFIGHNIKNFDFPFLIKRSIINGVSIPHQFHLQKKKPWENCIIDTYEIWKFGGFTSASLASICESLKIPSPKTIMDGSDVTSEYWNGNLENIKNYCELDVAATMNVILKMANMPLLLLT